MSRPFAQSLSLALCVTLFAGCAQAPRQLPAPAAAAFGPSADPALWSLGEIENGIHLPAPEQADAAPDGRAPVEALVLYAQARDSMLAGKRYTAINALEQALKIDPRSHSAYELLADAYQVGRAWDDRSIDALKKAAALAPDDLDVQTNLGRQLLAKGDLENAQQHLLFARLTHQYAQQESPATVADYFLARVLQMQGYDRAALELYARLLHRARSQVDSFASDAQLGFLMSQSIQLDIGDLYFKHGIYDAALAAFEPLAAASPDDFDLQSRVIRALTVLKRFSPAQERAARLVISLGGQANAVGLLLDVCRAAQKPNDLLPSVRRAGALQPNAAKASIAIARTAITIGAPASEVRRCLDEAQSRSSGDVESMYSVAGLYERAGLVRESAGALEQLLTNNPDHIGASNDLAYLLAESGSELERAMKLARSAVDHEPDRAAYLDTLGWVLYKRGDFAAAREALLRAVSDEENAQPIIFDHLGDAAYQLGDIQAARDAWTRATKLLEDAGETLRDPTERKVDQNVSTKLRQVDAGQRVEVAPIAAAAAPRNAR